MNREPDLLIVNDEDEIMGLESKDAVHDRILPHRAVWSFVYSPVGDVWLFQKRRPEKKISPGLWDLSSAGHVEAGDRGEICYANAIRREFGEELGLVLDLLPRHELRRAVDRGGPFPEPLGADLGYSREYTLSEKEHVHHYLIIYDGPVAISPGSEPMALGWWKTPYANARITDFDRVTSSCLVTFKKCLDFLT